MNDTMNEITAFSPFGGRLVLEEVKGAQERANVPENSIETKAGDDRSMYVYVPASGCPDAKQTQVVMFLRDGADEASAQAAMQIEKEQLRADLLRSISHDLRTPLTSISGNASNLLSNENEFSQETRMQIYGDIYDDSMWLIKLVENLLSVTRIEDGRMDLRMSAELMDEVIAEAMRHTDRNRAGRKIEVSSDEEFILGKMDARLIVQVVINLVDNAVKYTPEGAQIRIHTGKKDGMVVVSVSDTGPGIPDEQKSKVFEMFYTGTNRAADGRRSLGLGLGLCRSIIRAHGGEIWVSDNKPQGAVFTFTLPAEEVTLHE